MKPKIIRMEDTEVKIFSGTEVTDILNDSSWPYFSIAKVKKVSDDIREGCDTESNTAYYVLEGKGEALVDGRKILLKKGDCVVYPKGTKYKHLKGLTLLAIASPRFDRAKRDYTEK